MLGKIIEFSRDKKDLTIRLPAPGKFRLGETVRITRPKKARTMKQNSFYWCFLTWCISPDGGNLQDQGHFSVDGLHENIKVWFQERHGRDFGMEERFSTTKLDKEGFGRFLDIVNQELMVEFFGIDTSGFWREYETMQGEYGVYSEAPF